MVCWVPVQGTSNSFKIVVAPLVVDPILLPALFSGASLGACLVKVFECDLKV